MQPSFSDALPSLTRGTVSLSESVIFSNELFEYGRGISRILSKKPVIYAKEVFYTSDLRSLSFSSARVVSRQ